MAATIEQDLALTEQGWKNLQAELQSLKRERQARLSEYVDAARGAENSDARLYWESALIPQIDQRIASLEKTLSRALVIGQSDRDLNSVGVGSLVTVISDDGEEERYTVVGPPEADPSHGLVSYESPVGRALLGKRVGDEVTVATPGGPWPIKISRID